MEKQVFMPEDERKKCQKTADAFKELYENEDTVVLDAGRYGFVKLQYYNNKNGFDCVTTFTDSKKLFNSLWEDWLYTNLFQVLEDEGTESMEYSELIKKLPQEKIAEIMDRKRYFLEKCSG